MTNIDIDKLPGLETKRLILRVPTPQDTVEWVKFIVRNRDHFAPWNPVQKEEYYTENYWITELKEIVQQVLDGSRFQLALSLRSDQPKRIIGQCNFSPIIRGPFQAAILGYSLDYQMVGSGFMEEALTTAIAFCFEELHLHRIMANYMPTNIRSANLLRRLGFIPEGYARDYLHLAGEWQDHVLTALTNKNWNNI